MRANAAVHTERELSQEQGKKAAQHWNREGSRTDIRMWSKMQYLFPVVSSHFLVAIHRIL